MSKKYRSRQEDEKQIARAIAEKMPSIFPGWNPEHICGIFCDGQDGNGDCNWEKAAGPPKWWLDKKQKEIQFPVIWADTLEVNHVLENIGKFAVKRKIHSGLNSDVYEVTPSGLDRTYALKLAKTDASNRKLLSERAILEKLGHHKNITQIYFCGQHYENSADHSGSYHEYIVEDYSETTLREFLSAKKFNNNRSYPSFNVVIALLKQILSALEFSHKSGIIHQDLKPENILLSKVDVNYKGQVISKRWDVSLCDFGLSEIAEANAKLVSSLDDASAVAGTIQYLSPEQRSGDKIDHRTDLYTVGLILYEMLTLQKPAINLTKPTEVRKASAGLVTMPWIDDFVLKCLASKPKDRFKDAAEMIHAIEVGMRPPKPVVPLPAQEPVISMLQKVGSKLKKASLKTARVTGTVLKHVLLSPFYVLFAPFIITNKLWKWNEKGNNHLEGLVLMAAVAMLGIWYGLLPPIGFQGYLEYELVQARPTGTIVYYDPVSRRSEPRGFYFVDSSKLPDIEFFIIETPEIPDYSFGEFTPKYALSTENKLLYYTTPNSLVKIDLNIPKDMPGFRTTIVESAVFHYFSSIDIVDGKLYAYLQKETWHISSDGVLKNSYITRPVRQSPTVSSDEKFRVEDYEVMFNNSIPGNMNISSSLSVRNSVWYPQTIKLP